jgi:signal transduction histidine kinase
MGIEQIQALRLLLVDDEEDFRQTLVKRLSKRGIAASQAASGEACLALLAEQPMDVVVLDVKMPGIGGFDVLQRIKARGLSTEVILLTGHAATQDGVEGMKAGAFDYLSKPIEFEHLLGKIRQAYDKILCARDKQQAAEYSARLAQQMIATERLAALGTLAAGVAHEINNPLAIINESAGYMRLLVNKLAPDLPQREGFQKALDKIENSVKRARTITHQLLGSVRKNESVLAEVNMAELAGETMQLLAGQARDKNLKMDLEAPADLAAVWIEPNQVRQILINLLGNAVHATPEGGRVWVRISAGGGGVTLEVGDTGTGIPKENLVKIFEPFFSTKTPGQGTGLGLYVSRQIVEKLGGSIDVHSRVGQGSRFVVEIPNQVEPHKGEMQ